MRVVTSPVLGQDRSAATASLELLERPEARQTRQEGWDFLPWNPSPRVSQPTGLDRLPPQPLGATRPTKQAGLWRRPG